MYTLSQQHIKGSEINNVFCWFNINSHCSKILFLVRVECVGEERLPLEAVVTSFCIAFCQQIFFFIFFFLMKPLMAGEMALAYILAVYAVQTCFLKVRDT